MEFLISEKEQENIQNWHLQHSQNRHTDSRFPGPIGGSLSYIFIPTSIGTIGKVRCSCGAEFVFRDI